MIDEFILTIDAPQIAQIAQKVAKDRFELEFSPGLVEALATHIELRHGDEISVHNGGLAVNLTEQAFRRLAARVVVEGLFKTAASKVLIEADYLIGQAFPSKPLNSGSGAPDEEESTTEEQPGDCLPDLKTVLAELGISKYEDVLNAAEIRTNELCSISEEQLLELNLNVGARCKIKRFQMSHGPMNDALKTLRTDFNKLQEALESSY